MLTVLRLLNWRFHFYSDEGMEPPHIHVDTGDGVQVLAGADSISTKPQYQPNRAAAHRSSRV